MSNSIRERGLCVLRDNANQSPTAIHNAILDVRRNPESGDEQFITEFLEHYDPMVVAAALYSLYEVYDQRDVLLPIVERLAMEGDLRDEDDPDRPIQCMAVSALADFGRNVSRADVDRLVAIAESKETPVAPSECAWERLANLFAVPWPDEATEEMIVRPESDASERIRATIRKAIADKRNR